jgi:large subunit ribosomal protein L23
MSILDRLKKNPAAPKGKAGSAKAPKKEVKTDAAEAADVKMEKSVNGIEKMHAFTLVKPHVSEKAAHLAGKGIYVFDIPLTANKLEVRKAVEALYKVNVINVRTIRTFGKPVLRGKIAGRRSSTKKALVELKKGQTLNLVEGV